jgi:TPP-dependent pyruvate/acetoin dehydrogenase alpha subunit
MGTALARSESETHIARKAASYNLPAATIDGMDVIAVETAARAAVRAIRDGGGPRFLELATYRFRAHSMFDAELYRDKREVEEWKKRGPIVTFMQRLRDAALFADADLAQLETEIERELDGAIAFAESSTLEPAADLTKDVYTRAGAA